MKNSLRIITIGSIFLLCGASFFGIVSLKDEKVTSGFWNIRQIAVTTAYADDDRDDDRRGNDRNDDRDNDDDRDDNDDNDNNYTTPVTPVQTAPVVVPITPTPTTPTQTCTTVYDTVTNASGTATQVPRQSCTTNPVQTPTTPVVTPVVPATPPVQTPVTVTPSTATTGFQFRDGTYTGIGNYSFAGGSVNYSVSITVSSGRISQASFINFTASGNGKFTRAQGDAILQNIVNTNNANIDTVTGATGTSQAVQDAVDDALSKARITSATANSQEITDTNAVYTVNTNTTSSTSSVKYTAPNGKKYMILTLSMWAYVFERPDGTISSQKFTSSQKVMEFIGKNNPLIKEIATYTAPNKKRYGVLQNGTSGKYLFRRPDGTLSSKDFATKEAVLDYIKSNNPTVPVKIVTVKPKKSPAMQSKTPQINIVKRIAPTVTIPAKARAQAAAAQAKARAQAAAATAAKAKIQAPAKPVVSTPTPAPTPAPAPKVDTTTAAS